MMISRANDRRTYRRHRRLDVRCMQCDNQTPLELDELWLYHCPKCGNLFSVSWKIPERCLTWRQRKIDSWLLKTGLWRLVRWSK